MPVAAAGRARVTITEHPEGFAHTRSTIATMAKLAREGSHSYDVRSAATRIVHDVPSKQVRLELQAIYRWVRDNIRYRFDPVGLEWVQSPTRTMLERAGDCDDMATLIAALAGSLGHKWQFHTVGPSPSVMKHVAVEVWDGKGWVSLDPVLEPPGSSTAPRADLGMFGRSAPARARHTWSAEGSMLQGLNGPVHSQGVALWEGKLGAARLVHVGPLPGRIRSMRFGFPKRGKKRRRSSLSGAVSPDQYDLWSWAAYYPSDPQVRTGAGIAPIPSPVYRSNGAAGAVIVSAPAGQLSGGLGHIDGLGFGFLKKIGKAVGGVVKGVANVVTKIPGVDLVAKMIPGASLALDAAKMVGGMLSPGGGGGGGGAPAAAAPAAGPSPYAPAGSGGGGGGGAPAGARVLALAQRSDIDALRNDIRANAGLATKADLSTLAVVVSNRNSAEQAKAKKDAAAAAEKKGKSAGAEAEKKKALKAIAKLQKKQARAIAKRAKTIAALKAKLRASGKVVKKLQSAPCPSVARKYPAGSRQTFDKATGRYVVYAPQTPGAVAGLGFIKPTISFTLGAFGLATATQASNAVKAVAAFIKANKGLSPQVKLAAVSDFQRADGKLTADGLWGPNARVAAAWYLNQAPGALPPPAKPYAKGKITWKPPASKPPVAAAPKAAPKPKPAAKPKVIAAPKPKPKAAPKPKPAAKPKAIAAPKPAAKPKVIAAPKPKPKAAPKPKPAAKPSAYAPTPAARPAPQLTLIPKAQAQPSVAQLVPYAPAPQVPQVPGMAPAGIESSNPGLPPVGLESSSSSSSSSLTKPRITIDVSGPRIVDASAHSGGFNPLLLGALAWFYLMRNRRAA